MNKRMWSHYDWLEEHFEDFLKMIGIDPYICLGIIPTHGDKCAQYRAEWQDAGVPFSHGAALYLLTYLPPWTLEVRNTDKGFVEPAFWVAANYINFKPFLTFDDLEKVA